MLPVSFFKLLILSAMLIYAYFCLNNSSLNYRMRKYKSLFFSVLLFLTACSGNTIPDKIIKPEQMTSLLMQIHVTDGTLYNISQMPDSLYKYGTARYLALFKQFHTDSATFRKSYKYYSEHPELLNAMYDQITISLKQKVDSLTKIDQERIKRDTKRRADSIKKIPPAKRRADSIKNAEEAKKRQDSIQKLYMNRRENNPYKNFNNGLKHRIPPHKNAVPDKLY